VPIEIKTGHKYVTLVEGPSGNQWYKDEGVAPSLISNDLQVL